MTPLVLKEQSEQESPELKKRYLKELQKAKRLKERLGTWVSMRKCIGNRLQSEYREQHNIRLDLHSRLLSKLTELVLKNPFIGDVLIKEYIIDELLALLKQKPEDAELIANFNRISPISYAETQRINKERYDELVKSIFGDGMRDPFSNDTKTADELIARFVAEHIKALEEESAHDAMQSKKDDVLLTVTVKALYKRMASKPHPDREKDEATRLAKTALLQSVNTAYAKSDLYALMELVPELVKLEPTFKFDASFEELVAALERQNTRTLAEISSIERWARKDLSMVKRGKIKPDDLNTFVNGMMEEMEELHEYQRYQIEILEKYGLAVWIRDVFHV